MDLLTCFDSNRLNFSNNCFVKWTAAMCVISQISSGGLTGEQSWLLFVVTVTKLVILTVC